MSAWSVLEKASHKHRRLKLVWDFARWCILAECGGLAWRVLHYEIIVTLAEVQCLALES